VLLVAGSTGMAGAAALAALGALRAGAGLVAVCAPDRICAPLAALLPCAVIHPMPSTRDGTLSVKALQPILDLSVRAHAAAVGPGLKLNRHVVTLMGKLLPSLSVPLVLDADGLNAVARIPKMIPAILPPTVLTPHPGELGRLLRASASEIQQDRERRALEAARKFKAVVLLKGHRTIVTDGARLFVNRTGNPGMATGGSGDVLTGVIAALVAQGLRLFDAACLGAHVHGRAGDLAARARGQVSLIATDLVEALPAAFRGL
jgi:NAD(P)H-hydrate epimerase